MKIIDHTPYRNEKGEISLIDRLKAYLQFGSSWYPEIQAQEVIIGYLDRALNRNFTLLRNILLPSLGVRIPMILVGPSGVYTLYVTNLRGMYRAQGDLWGSIEGGSLRIERVNLLTRTARLARALQVYLQRQGYEGLITVEGVLLAAEAGLHVDSQRPIVRIVMRDALERFAVSVAQARMVISQEAVQEIANRILHPRSAQQQQSIPKPQPAFEEKVAPEIQTYEPKSTFEETAAPEVQTYEPQPWSTEKLDLDSFEESLPEPSAEIQTTYTPEETPTPLSPRPQRTDRSTRTRFTRRQWSFIIIFALVEIIILIVFLSLVLRTP